jgi:predicted DsbA family dithiol-disulfide isomerase
VVKCEPAGILRAMVEVRYYTDPACPWSWALEPFVRKLMLDFSSQLSWSFVMGGLERDLLPGKSGPGLRLEPATRLRLVEEWLRVAAATQAPLDPLIWSESPLRSTHPACMAVKAATEQGADAAYRYLRRLREGVMCARRKLDHAEALVEEARGADLDVERFRLDLRSHAITEMFGADLEETQALGPGGLPSIKFTGEDGTPRLVSGFASFEEYRAAASAAGARASEAPPPSVEELIARFGTLTTREAEVLAELPGPRAGAELFRLAEQWRLRPQWCLTGHLWQAA